MARCNPPILLTKWTFARGRISCFIDQHPGNNCVLFIELFTNRHVKKKITTVSIFIPIVAIWLWDLRNNYSFYNLLQFLTFDLFITYILYKVFRSWTIAIGRDIFFSAEDYTNMSYYNCCGIRPKHSNISTRGSQEPVSFTWL